MVWVRSEHAGELAVVSAWLAALVPWNITYASLEGIGGILSIRFVFLEVQYFTEIVVDGRSVEVLALHDAIARQAGEFVYLAYLVWATGTAFVTAAVAVSIVYYLHERRLESGSVDPVRLIGWLLAAAGIAFLVANYLLVTRGIPGIPLPVGTVLILVMAAVLLTVDRVDHDAGSVSGAGDDFTP